MRSSRLPWLVAMTIVAVTTAATLTPADGAQVSRRAKRTCTPKRTVTLLATKSLRVYRTRRPGLGEQKVYGCLYRRKRRVFLGRHECFNQPPAVEELRAAGSLVAYAQVDCSPGGTSSDVVVRSLGSGRRLKRIPVRDFDPMHPRLNVEDLVLRRGGAVAWIESASAESAPPTRVEVHKSDADGHNVILDSGPTLGLRSLALAADGTLYWRKGAAPAIGRLR
jgi:hypothetical protein